MKPCTFAVLIACMPLLSTASAQHVGDEAPDFSLVDKEGMLVHLSGFRGTPVVLNFWATWCLPCREELPLFQRIGDEVNQDSDVPEVVFLLVNKNETPEAARRFLAELDITLTGAFDATRDECAQLSGVDLDTSADVLRRYRVRGLPTTLFIDAEGIIRGIKVGELLPFEAPQLLASIGVTWQP
jgi:cytochrome c biogenesis protein CcmG, thiol:disulfide interchange protein DsbE